MLISFVFFPLTFLVWAIAGTGAVILGRRAPRAETTSSERTAAVVGIILVIAALTTTASIQILAYQRGSVTQMTLKALIATLEQQRAESVR